MGDYQQFIVIIQFNDSIAYVSLNSHKMQIISNSKEMVRRHMVRGYDEKIFYCESNGTTDSIQEL